MSLINKYITLSKIRKLNIPKLSIIEREYFFLIYSDNELLITISPEMRIISENLLKPQLLQIIKNNECAYIEVANNLLENKKYFELAELLDYIPNEQKEYYINKINSSDNNKAKNNLIRKQIKDAN